jgi:hypothetical protein
MKYRAFKGRIVFDHLPKTAGQAINSWLIQELGSGCVTPNLNATHNEFIRQYGGEYSVLSGHINFESKGLDPRYQYVTLFRDPIDRVISWLYFVVNNHNSDELKVLFQWAEEFINSNGLVCNNNLKPYISDLYVEHFISISTNDIASKEEKIAIALEAVKQYNVIGFYDEMPRFLEDFSSLLGIPAPETIERVNVTKERPAVNNISTQLRDSLVKLNFLDIEFYEQLREWYFMQERVEKPLIKESPWDRYDRLNLDRVFVSSEFQVRDVILKEGYHISHGQALCFEVEFVLDRNITELEAGIHIWDTQNRWAFGTNSTLQKKVIYNVVPGIYRTSYYVIADLSEGVYTAGFAFFEKLIDGSVNELMWHDKLCEFRVSYPAERLGIGYANLPTTVALTQIGSFEKNLIFDGSGCIKPIAISTEIKPSEIMNVDVEIHNDTDVTWKGDLFRPINLSYHWLDENDEIVLFDGIRTPLPERGISAHCSVLATIEIVAPEQEGKYKLILTMVQETVGWFEDIGFQSYICDIKVK